MSTIVNVVRPDPRTITIRRPPRPYMYIQRDYGPEGPTGPQGPPGPPVVPEFAGHPGQWGIPTSGGKIGLEAWYPKAAAAKSTGRAKILVLGDSISETGGTKSWANLMSWITSRFNDETPKDILGARFPRNQFGGALIDSCPGTSSDYGLAGFAKDQADGTETTHAFYGDGVTIVYGKGSGGGTVSVYDGPSSGTAVTSFSTAGTTGYSYFQDVALPMADHTVTLKVTGGTLHIEAIIPHCSTMTQGFDIVQAAHFGYSEITFADVGVDGGTTLTQSHGLDFVARWQPDLVIVALGENDADAAQFQSRHAHLVDAIHSRAGSAVVLSCLPAKSDTITDPSEWETAISAVMSTRSAWLAAIDWAAEFGRIKGVSNMKPIWNVSDSVHPSIVGCWAAALTTLATILGDPAGVLMLAHELGSVIGMEWVGSTTGKHVGQMHGIASPAVVEVAASGAVSSTWLTASPVQGTVFYDGATDITLTFPNNWGVLVLFSDMDAVEVPLRFVQLGTGTITLAATSPTTLIGDTATTTAGDVLDTRSCTAWNSGNTVISHLN